MPFPYATLYEQPGEKLRTGPKGGEILKVCVCSDSHGNAASIDRMLLREQPDVLLFLGDGLQDLNTLPPERGCKRYVVAGNCDFGSGESEMRLVHLENVRILMLHGHRAAVKTGLLRLSLLAQEHRADIAVYGHTHRQDAQWAERTLLLCPGSIGSASGAYAVLDVKDGRYDFTLKQEGEC